MYPKQLLPMVSERTMLQETALRTSGARNICSRPIVVCNDLHRFLVAEQLRAINVEADIILEPEGRSTAPAAALAAMHAIACNDDDSDDVLLLIMPADHVIRDPAAFLDALAVGEVAARSGALVTLGVVPTYAHTGYGYIEADKAPGTVAPVRSFVEKPDADTAVEMVESGRFFWNAGIFLFSANAWLEELDKYRPEIVSACAQSYDDGRADADYYRPDVDKFKTSPSDSIDYAVMEKTDRAVVVPLDAGWNDIGSWAALHDVCEQDDSGNTLFGDVIAIDCRRSYISGTSRLVTAVGINNLVIVEEKDSILIADRDKSEDVKRIVEQLERAGRDEGRLHRQVFRPWGSYDSVDHSDGFQVKRLIVNPGAVLSLQKHAHRSEHWVVVRGTARITRDGEVFDLAVNQSTHIPIGAVHRIENPGTEPVHIIEVQCGDYLGEDDIVRIEDNYGREGTNT
jgi:mannose-1-phosphate guanylyltransferase/mannose-6-phosphate isomerase